MYIFTRTIDSQVSCMANPPTAQVPATSGASPANASHSTSQSYAAVVTKAYTTPSLTPVPLANRPITYVANMPAIILTSVEEDQLRKQRENTLIMKFSAGMPNLYEIRSHIHSEWNLERSPAVGIIDKRHITLHMASSMDTKRALAHTTNKIKTSMFRVFRWTPDFEVGKDSALAAVWVKMFNLPLHYYNEASLYRLGSILGTVLRIHPSTHALTQQSYAKVCIELDVSKPLIDKLWIGTSKEYGWEISLEYEGNHAYCDYCGLLGHTLGLCRKKREDQGKAVAKEGETRVTEPHKLPHGKNNRKEQWVAKNTEVEPGKDSETNRAMESAKNTVNKEPTHMEYTPKPGDVLIRDHVQDVSEGVLQKLRETGLLTASNSENQDNGFEMTGHSRDNQHGGNLPEHVRSPGISPSEVLGTESREPKNQENVHSAKSQELMGSKSATPTSNKILATEEELHTAFENLQRSKDKTQQTNVVPSVNEQLDLALIDACLSDGAGTKDKSNTGVKFQSAPNSDGEDPTERD